MRRDPPTVPRRALLLGALGALGAPRSARGFAVPAPRRAMPALFVSHGAPTLAIDPVRGPELARWGAALPRPTGIVAVTPHVRALGLELGDTGRGRAIYSFPPGLAGRLGRLAYDSPPSAALASRVEALLSPRWPVARSTAGLDHTVWMPLLHLVPGADVPVVQLAMPFWHERELFALGRALAPLRAEQVIVLCSGGMTHNLAAMDLAGRETPPAWAVGFDRWAAEQLTQRDADALLDWRARAPDAAVAHPDDGGHFHALLVALGAAMGDGPAPAARFAVQGFEFGAQSQRCVELG